VAQALIELFLHRLGLLGSGQVPGQLGEAARIAGLIPNRREDHVRPKRRSVLANAPALILESSPGCHHIQVAPRLAALDVFTEIKLGEVTADDLFGAITLD